MTKYVRYQNGSTQVPDGLLSNLGVVAGDLLEFVQEGDAVIIRKKSRDFHAIIAKHAIYNPDAPRTHEEFLKQSREERGWDEEDELAFDRWAELREKQRGE
jgi:bifunctional DNA-binding transcriptional regulator/antitoxin component of YhaV-PrlF toxin-antitoxin module